MLWSDGCRSVSYRSPNRELKLDRDLVCRRGELSPYPAVSNADERNLDFFEHGDTIYADFPPQPCLSLRATLQEYRAKQSEVYETALA